MTTQTSNTEKVKEVIELEPFNDEYVYDIGVSDTHPYFFANDILVHNSCFFSAWPKIQESDPNPESWTKERELIMVRLLHKVKINKVKVVTITNKEAIKNLLTEIITIVRTKVVETTTKVVRTETDLIALIIKAAVIKAEKK
jgi:intein/homing endonuclease